MNHILNNIAENNLAGIGLLFTFYLSFISAFAFYFIKQNKEFDEAYQKRLSEKRRYAKRLAQ
jgi:hypothetical protein